MFMLNDKPINIHAQVTIGDVQYPAAYFRDPASRAAAGISEAPDPIRPDDRYYYVTDNGDGSFTAVPRDLDQVKALKLADIAASRYQLEVGGVVVAGTRIATDRGSQSMLASATLTVIRDPSRQIDWKNSDGSWTQIDKATVEAIADVVSSHVQACFTAERARCETLAALTDFAAVVAFDPEVTL